MIYFVYNWYYTLFKSKEWKIKRYTELCNYLVIQIVLNTFKRTLLGIKIICLNNNKEINCNYTCRKHIFPLNHICNNT